MDKYQAMINARGIDDIEAATKDYCITELAIAESHVHSAMVGALIQMLSHERASYDELAARLENKNA